MWGLADGKIIENVIVIIFSLNKIFSNSSFKNGPSFFSKFRVFYVILYCVIDIIYHSIFFLLFGWHKSLKIFGRNSDFSNTSSIQTRFEQPDILAGFPIMFELLLRFSSSNLRKQPISEGISWMKLLFWGCSSFRKLKFPM